MHNGRPVTVKTPHAAFRLCHRNSKRYLGGVTHGTDCEEIALVALFHGDPVFEELPAYHSRGAHDAIFLTKCSSNGLNGLFPTHGKVALFYVLEFVVLKSALFYDQRIHLFIIKGTDSFGNLFFSLILFLGEHIEVNPHDVEQPCCDFPLFDVLRFVVYAGTSPPTDEQEDGDVIYFGIGERSQRINNIALSAVLHIDTCRFACCQIMAGRQAHGRTFIGGYDIMPSITMVCDISANVLEQTVGNTGKTGNPALSEFPDKKFRSYHYSSGMSVIISLMDIHLSSHSLARWFSRIVRAASCMAGNPVRVS